MVVSDQLVEIMRCPLDRSRLHRAPADLVAKINRAIKAGSLANRAGKRLEKPIDDGLMREAGDLVYPIIDDIPAMLPDEAIEVSRV
jgi:uncharacterized protein YbaR (Trm112 family)